VIDPQPAPADGRRDQSPGASRNRAARPKREAPVPAELLSAGEQGAVALAEASALAVDARGAAQDVKLIGAQNACARSPQSVSG